MNIDIDVRPVLPAVQAPTLVIRRAEAGYALDDPRRIDPAVGEYLAERIPGARLVTLPGRSSNMYAADAVDVLEPFLVDAWKHSQQRELEPQRVLATVLFTDLAGSTQKAVELGARWPELLREHNQRIRRELARYSGREIDTAGDGFFASGFDGPARAIRCGCAIRDAIGELGLGVRVGVHTGECELVDDKLAGLAVVIGSRVAAQAEPGEVLVSGTVKDLVAGSGIEFEPRGARELKGLGEWPVYAVTGA